MNARPVPKKIIVLASSRRGNSKSVERSSQSLIRNDLDLILSGG